MTLTVEPETIVQYLNPVELFSGFERDGFRLLDPTTDTSRLTRRVRAAGICLNPVIFAGDILHIDESAVPVHGDLVEVAWSDKIVSGWEASPKRQEWIDRFGSTDFRRGVKLFYRFPVGAPDSFQDTYYVCNTEMSLAPAGKVLGVVRAVERNGRLLTGDLVTHDASTAGLDIHAATDTGSVVVATDSHTFAASLTILQYAFSSLNYTNNSGTSVEVEVTATGNRSLATGSGTGFVNASWTIAVNNVTAGGTSVTTPLSSIPEQILGIGPSTTVPLILESEQFLISIPSGTQYSFTPIFSLDCACTFSSTLSTTGYTMRIAAIKR